MTRLGLPPAVALALLVIVAAGWDLAARRIPNPLVLAGALAGVVLHVGHNGWAGLATSLLGLLVGFAVFLPLFLLRGMGGGDVKLMAAIGALAGPQNCLLIFVLTALIGGVLAVALLLWKGGLAAALGNCAFIIKELACGRLPHARRPQLTIDSDQAVSLPYAVPMALGSLAFLLL